MMFLVSSGTMIFLLPEDVILFFGRKMKDDLSQKILGNMMFSVYQIHGNIIFSSNVLKRWSFQKKTILEYDLSCIIRKEGPCFCFDVFCILGKYGISSSYKHWVTPPLKK